MLSDSWHLLCVRCAAPLTSLGAHFTGRHTCCCLWSQEVLLSLQDAYSLAHLGTRRPLGWVPEGLCLTQQSGSSELVFCSHLLLLFRELPFLIQRGFPFSCSLTLSLLIYVSVYILTMIVRLGSGKRGCFDIEAS